jgi:hypothetical protein
MAEENALDTTIHEPPLETAGEVEVLLFAVERSRAQFAWKCGGLAASDLHQALAPSTMTMAGLIKHLALVEDSYTAEFLDGKPLGEPWNRVPDGPSLWEWSWRSAAQDRSEDLYALWCGAVERSRAAWRRVLAAGDLSQRSAWTTSDGQSPNLRRALVDLHDEYARHVGHADLLREAIDGLVGEDPPQP